MKIVVLAFTFIFLKSLFASELYDTYFPTRWSANVENSSWDYSEYEDNSEFMNDNGNLKGIGISYNVPFKNYRWLFQVDASYLQGETRYTGSLSNGDELIGDNINKITTLNANFGKILTHFDMITIPMIGITVRRLSNPKSGDLDGSYDRTVQWNTINLGVNLRKSFFNKNYFELIYTYKYFLSGWVSSELSDVHDDFSDPVLTVNSGHSNLYSLGYFHHVDKYIIGASFYYEHWLVDESEEKTIEVPTAIDTSGEADVNEPENETFQSGLKLHFMW